MQCIEIVQIIKEIIISLAAITTVSLAIYGLRSWFRELKGKVEFEVARDLLKSTYKLRDSIWNFRLSIIFASEFPKDYNQSFVKLDYEKEANAQAYVYNNRWKYLSSAVIDFDSKVLEAEALWGDFIANKTDELRSCVTTLHISLRFLIDYVRMGINPNEDTHYKKVREEISASRDSNDELSIKIRTSIENIENALKPHLRRK